ncbi:MAG: DEAD/DEAH box helicase [Saprospiraceae bacterium]|nr:DEAD/DEAH box helicase [Saprospiraceae bacterium]
MPLIFPPEIIVKARILHLRNAVTLVSNTQDEYYNGSVMGSRIYDTTLILGYDDGILFSECNCVDMMDCKHGAALAVHLLSLSTHSEEPAQGAQKLAELKEKYGTKRVDSFRELPIVAPLTLQDTVNALSYINRYHSLNYFEIELTGQNEILASAFLRDWQNYIDRDSKNSMTIKTEQEKIYIKCNSCQKNTERLCEHQQVVLGNHLVQSKILSLLNNELDYEHIVEKCTVQLGLIRKTFLENFAIRLDAQGVNLVALSNDILVDTGNFPALDAYLKQEPPKDEITDYFQHIEHKNMMTNALAWSHKNSVFLLEGKLKKTGDILASHINQVNSAYHWESGSRDIGSAILEAFESKNQQMIHEVLKKYVEPLSDLIHYFLLAEPWNNDKIKRKDLLPFKLSIDFAILLIKVREDAEFTNLEFAWQLGDNQMSIDQAEWSNHFFVGRDGMGFLVDNKESIQFLKAISFKEKLRIPIKSRSVLKSILDKASHAGSLTFQNLKTEELKGGVKQIYLREVGSFLVCEPSLLYQEHRFPLFSGQGIVLPELDGQLVAEKEKVVEFKAEFKSMHASWDKPFWPQGFAYLPLSEVIDGFWFFNFITKAEEFQIEIFGQESLNTLRFNLHRPVINTGIKSGIDWFEAKVDISFGGDLVAQKDWVDFIKSDQKYIRLRDGSMGILPDVWIKRLRKLVSVSEVAKDSLQISKLRFNIVDELFELIDDDRLRKEIAEKKRALAEFDKNKKYQLPPNINATLRPYQKLGYQWLRFLDEFNFGGCLADDMGLGKTIQVIVFLLDQKKQSKGTSLVVIPKSLLFNWSAELDRFGHDLRYFIHHGQARDRGLKDTDDYDVILSTYDTIARDATELRNRKFNYIILDESQAIKNPNSIRYKSLRLLKARNRLAMTGTPIENNTFDLYAQFSFLNPSLLGRHKSFKDHFSNPIDNFGDESASATLRKIVHPFLLRRTKEQVAKDLPEKTETILYCDMEEEQRKFYEIMRERIKREVADKVEEGGINKAKFKILEGLLRLRQICNSPELVDNSLPPNKKQSIKIDMLMEQIKEELGSHRALIFSQFVSMLTLIRQALDKENINYSYLDGSTTNRKAAVDNFLENPDCKLFLISLKAGNTGLNLVKADYVYIVDPWWNPAVEAQAIDRTHRIGQTKNIFAYKLICKDTIEEKILQLQQKKKKLASDIIQTDEKVFKSLKKDELLALFD